MQEGPSEEVELEEVVVENPPPFGFVANPEGGVSIFIRDNEGRFEEGIVNVIGDPKGTLAASARLPFGPFVEKLITQYLLDSLKIYIRLIKNLVQHRQKGVANTVKTAFLLPLTMGWSVLGGFLPTHWISPTLGANLQGAINSVLPFLPQDVAFGIGIFISVSIVTNYGNRLSDKLLFYIFNHILNTPDPLLHFTEGEIAHILENEGQAASAGLIQKFKDTISFLQGMALKEQNSYQDFASTRRDREITRVSEKLRDGNFRPLLRYAEHIRSKNMISLNSATRNTEGNRDEKRRAEMFFAEGVLQSFRNRL